MVREDIHCSDVHDIVDTDDQYVLEGHANSVQEMHNQGDEHLTIAGCKITTHQDKVPEAPADINITSSSPTERASDAASIRSLPTVQVSEPASPDPRPSTALSPDSVPIITNSPDQAPSLSRTPRSAAHDRRLSAHLDNRATNRFSGFISNLIHRRDTLSTPPPRQNMREGRPNSPAVGNFEIPSRPGTPPPSLPPPTLHELGLNISMVTSILSPSHFSSPPTSGAFLSPHYLLLCHTQGLDVLPLVSPPAAIPYALVRRVPFKHVVIMEQRGVLVAIAGRRDGVRVYALDEVRKAVGWRIEVELRRERERARREEAKRIVSGNCDDSGSEFRGSEDKLKATIPVDTKSKLTRKSSSGANIPTSRAITGKKPKPSPVPPSQPFHPEDPPPYTHVEISARRSSAISAHQLIQRSPPVNSDIISCDVIIRQATATQISLAQGQDIKPDWLDSRGSSDEEAIDIVAAGASGSQALDERTSAMTAAFSSPRIAASPIPRSQPSQTQSSRRRPANLDLTRINTNNFTAPLPPPSPTPTLLTLRQALESYPSSGVPHLPDATNTEVEPTTPDGDDDDDGRQTPTESISLAQALMESRLPNLPPAGTRHPQQPILIASHPVVTGEMEPQSPSTSESTFTSTRRSVGPSETSNGRRRRWSVLDGIFTGTQGPPISQLRTPGSPMDISAVHDPPSPLPSHTAGPRTLVRSQSGRTHPSTSDSTIQPSASSSNLIRPSSSPSTSSRTRAATPTAAFSVPSSTSATPTRPRSRSRFIPRIISNAFNSRRNNSISPHPLSSEQVKALGIPTQSHAPAPKLEYVKLPGTKGALLVKAVETAKKSFLAILCGDRGEKVELFAGTYRTALGLSRTFILPDSPRSLELQLQGDDLVEVFLVFSQNVFGLEPATVRVREVRIGRAERRAARRRARDRENLLDEPFSVTDTDAATHEDETGVTVSVTVSTMRATENYLSESGQPPLRSQNLEDQQAENANNGLSATSDELAALAAAQTSPYSTFQQLSFSPNFPLASIADEYMIPPTYPSFLQYRSQYEPESVGENNVDVTHQLSPPGLPLPVPLPPCKWFYRDPKGVVHGPWKASLMQGWYKDGLLPPDLPVRREEESEYVLLKELRLQCVDPTQPFGTSWPQMILPTEEDRKPLLRPISLLAQPPHFGPPALFFSSRGGHSTTIVDSRGRLVLKGRFLWSQDDVEDDKQSDSAGSNGRMGDVKRLEAIDMGDRSVLVAMRQGGLEAVDLRDALLRPADGSRTLFPHFNPPPSSINRRGPFVWKIGTPISSGSSPAGIIALKPPGGPRGSSKKPSNGPGKSPGRADFLMHGGELDGDHPIQDEILFFGRKNDNLYLCERNAGCFRILRLCPCDVSS